MAEKVPHVLPHSAEAERAALGAMLRQEENLVSGFGALRAADFYLPAHKLLFSAMQELYNESKPVDEVTLIERLDQRGQLKECGGVTYITDLRQSLPVLGNFPHYLGLIQSKTTLRRLANAASDIQTDVFESGEDLGTILSHAERRIFDISMKNNSQAFLRIDEPILESFRLIGERQGQSGLTGLASGFVDLDQKLSGLQKSDLIVIAGRPAMGKTSFAINIAQYAATHENAVVAIFSLEMAAEQLTTRMLCTEARVDMQLVRGGVQLPPSDWERLTQALGVLSQSRIFIDDTGGVSLSEMRSKLRRLKIEQGQLDLVVVDYLQLMEYKGRADNRQQQISEITRQFKMMARELDVPILLISQLSRGAESRTSKRPMMSDLRESGAIEQDADIIILLYREGYYDEEAENPNIAQAIVAKHRNGPTGDIDLFWRGEYTLFESVADDFHGEEPW